jgi:hypothetical protein
MAVQRTETVLFGKPSSRKQEQARGDGQDRDSSANHNACNKTTLIPHLLRLQKQPDNVSDDEHGR